MQSAFARQTGERRLKGWGDDDSTVSVNIGPERGCCASDVKQSPDNEEQESDEA